MGISKRNGRGTVQTLTCQRNGAECWRKQVFIPFTEQTQAYEERAFKRHGEFLYDLVGEVKTVSRKPVNVDKWNA